MNYEDIISFEALWESSKMCQCGVRWKPSVKQFIINSVEEIIRMNDKLKSGDWKNGRPREIQILYPKKRDGLSIPFRDRVYQRAINDYALYPEMTKHFIFDNAACQKGKGTSFARRRIKEHLRRFFRKNGIGGYVLQIDIHGYYPSMRHDAVKDCFGKYITGDMFKAICDILDTQYSGDIGYSPGSQMVQIAGISLLNDIDHYIKERLHVKHYIRYMDDFTIIHENKEFLEQCLISIEQKLNEIGFEINHKKTTIRKLKDGFRFLGFDYRVTDTGKIIMTVNSESVKHERKKLYRMVQKCKRGEMDKSKADECFRSWKAFAMEGNSYRLIERLNSYYDELWR